MSTRLTLIARLTAKPEHADALGEGLRRLVAPTTAEPGSIGYVLHRDNDDPRVWILYETWRSRADLDAHFEQPYTKAMLAQFPELLAREMELTFCTVEPRDERRQSAAKGSHMPLTLTCSRAAIVAAEAKAAALGVPVNVAVLDAGAHLKAFSRMDGAVLGSIDIAMKKARTAVLFQATSEAVWEYCKPGAPAPGLELTNGGLAPFGGGVPLFRPDGTLAGAIGVSGGAVSQDMDIAQAGASAWTDTQDRS